MLTCCQLGVLFQVIEKAGSIPWDELELPEGRTKKAVQIMIGKEKDKVKKAREAKGNGEPVAETPKVRVFSVIACARCDGS